MAKHQMFGEPVLDGHTPSRWYAMAGPIVGPTHYVPISGIDIIDPDSGNAEEYVCLQEEAKLALNNKHLSPRYRRIFLKWYRNDMIDARAAEGEGVSKGRITQIINKTLHQIRHPAWNTIPNPFITPVELPNLDKGGTT